MNKQLARHRLDGGVLTYVLSIGVLVSVGLSMLILYVYYSRLEYKSYDRQLRIHRNLVSAQQITLGSPESFRYNQEYLYDLYDQGSDSVYICRYSWGVLDLFHITAFNLSDTVEKWYTQAYARADKTNGAVFLVDDGRPLSLSGDTRLEGDCYLPVAGVQSAYVDRIGYRNEELVYGKQLKSDKEFPEFSLEIYFDQIKTVQGQYTDLYADTIRNSFFDVPLIIDDPMDTLSNVFIGNMLIRSSRRVVFDSLASTANGVVVNASIIELMPGFKGEGQFLATDTLIVHEGVELDYPTVLACYNEDEQASMVLNKGSKVSGWLMIDGEEHGFRRRVIYIEDGAQVNGMIFCNGLLETYGDINGHATVKRFLVNSTVGVYENYLMNATIKGGELDSAFLTFNHWFSTKEAQILEYLY